MLGSHPHSTLRKTFRSNELGLAAILIPIIAGGMGGALVLSSAYGAKWFVMIFLSICAFFSMLYFNDLRVFGMWLLASCIPIVFQYRLLTHGDKGHVLDHFGGAANEPVVSLVDFPIIFMLICLVVDLANNRFRKLPRWLFLDTLIVVFMVYSSFSLLNTTEHALFIFEMIRYIKYLALYWTLRIFLASTDEYAWGGIFVVSLLTLPLQAMLSGLQYFFFFRLPIPVGGVSMSGFELVNGELIQRVTGFVGHSNTFAHYLLVPLCFCVTLFFAKISIRAKILVVPFFVCGLIPLVLTFSRSGWLTFCICSGIIGLLALHTKRLKLSIVAMIVAAGLFVIGGIMVTDVWEVIMVRIFEDSGNAYDSRWDLAGLASRVILDYPVFGVGLNSFEENMIKYDINGIRNVIDQPVHNVFLLIAAETGVPSLLIFFALLLTLLCYCKVILKRNSEWDYFIGTVGFSVIMGLAFTNMFDLSLRKEALLGMLTLVAAFIVTKYDGVTSENIAERSFCPLDVNEVQDQ